MLKKRLRKWVPTPGKVRQSRSLRIFGSWVEDSHLWQLSRHTTAKAFGIGLYCAMLPVPGQMIISVALAIVFTANVPLSFSLIFITNPLTMPAIYYAAYKLGAWVLGYRTAGYRVRGFVDLVCAKPRRHLVAAAGRLTDDGRDLRRIGLLDDRRDVAQCRVTPVAGAPRPTPSVSERLRHG